MMRWFGGWFAGDCFEICRPDFFIVNGQWWHRRKHIGAETKGSLRVFPNVGWENHVWCENKFLLRLMGLGFFVWKLVVVLELMCGNGKKRLWADVNYCRMYFPGRFIDGWWRLESFRTKLHLIFINLLFVLNTVIAWECVIKVFTLNRFL